MPIKPKTICKHPGCGRIAESNGYCDKHKAPQRDKAVHNLYDKYWERERKIFLAENPWCQDCLEHGRYEPATEVHHSIPHRGNRSIFWDKSKWRALSKSCHSKHTARGE